MESLTKIDENLTKDPSNLAQILLLLGSGKWQYHFENVSKENVSQAVVLLTTLNEEEKSNLKEGIESVLKVVIEKKWIEEIRKQLIESKIENAQKVEELVERLNSEGVKN
jgi:hypothetical protein